LPVDELVKGVLSGERRALAKMISLIEDEHPEAELALCELYRHTGNAHIVGVTGPPGSGKSTLVTRMTSVYRSRGKTIGIICVDPSSPFSGGALLGDRIRMQEHSLDDGVYMRSMGTRGHLGGIARATSDAVRVLDAAGKDIVIVETVGAGQSEVEVVDIAHTVVVTDVPGSGDDIQAIKAGIMEIGDVFVVNKHDLPGADKKVTEINAMLDLDQNMGEWRPPVVTTNARKNEGITELVDEVTDHMEYLRASGELEERELQRSREELEDIMRYRLTRELLAKFQDSPEYAAAIQKIACRSDDPYSVAQRMIAEFLASYRE
jgi:LAO/AO transport system kinase